MLPDILMGFGVGANALGSFLNKPVNPYIDINGILNRMRDRENRYVNNLVGRGASMTGQNMAAQGIRGGAAAQVMGQIEAPIRAESLGRMQDAEARLREQQAAQDAAFKQAKNQWLGGLLGNLGGGVAAIGTGLQQQGTVKALAEIDAQRQKSMMEYLAKLFAQSGNALPGALQSFGGQPQIAGFNAWSNMDREILNPRAD